MTEDVKESYDSGEIVWVKLGSVWWPGEVKNPEELPSDILNFRKPPLVIVKFFDEDSYEFVKKWSNIFPYNCKNKNDFIKKGLVAVSSKSRHVNKFPKDVQKAEAKIGGTADILNDPMFLPENKKSSTSSVLTPWENNLQNKERFGDGRSDNANKHANRLVHKPAILNRDYKAFICIQHPSKDRTPGDREDDEVIRINEEPEERTFNCHSCSFTTKRLEVMFLHAKWHIQGVYLSSAPKVVHPVFRRKRSRRPRGSEDIDSDVSTTDSESVRQRKRKWKNQGVRAKRVKKTDTPSKDIARSSKNIEESSDTTQKTVDTSIKTLVQDETADDLLNGSGNAAINVADSNKTGMRDADQQKSPSQSIAEDVTDDLEESMMGNQSESMDHCDEELSIEKSREHDCIAAGTQDKEDDLQKDEKEGADADKSETTAPNGNITDQEMRKLNDEVELHTSQTEMKVVKDNAVVSEVSSEDVSQELEKQSSTVRERNTVKVEAKVKEGTVLEKMEEAQPKNAFEESMETPKPSLSEEQDNLKCEQNFHHSKRVKFPDKQSLPRSPPIPEIKALTDVPSTPNKPLGKSLESFEKLWHDIHLKDEEIQTQIKIEPSKTEDTTSTTKPSDSKINVSILKSKIMMKIHNEEKVAAGSNFKMELKMQQPESKSKIRKLESHFGINTKTGGTGRVEKIKEDSSDSKTSAEVVTVRPSEILTKQKVGRKLNTSESGKQIEDKLNQTKKSEPLKEEKNRSKLSEQSQIKSDVKREDASQKVPSDTDIKKKFDEEKEGQTSYKKKSKVSVTRKLDSVSDVVPLKKKKQSRVQSSSKKDSFQKAPISTVIAKDAEEKKQYSLGENSSKVGVLETPSKRNVVPPQKKEQTKAVGRPRKAVKQKVQVPTNTPKHEIDQGTEDQSSQAKTSKLGVLSELDVISGTDVVPPEKKNHTRARGRPKKTVRRGNVPHQVPTKADTSTVDIEKNQEDQTLAEDTLQANEDSEPPDTILARNQALGDVEVISDQKNTPEPPPVEICVNDIQNLNLGEKLVVQKDTVKITEPTELTATDGIVPTNKGSKEVESIEEVQKIPEIFDTDTPKVHLEAKYDDSLAKITDDSVVSVTETKVTADQALEDEEAQEISNTDIQNENIEEKGDKNVVENTVQTNDVTGLASVDNIVEENQVLEDIETIQGVENIPAHEEICSKGVIEESPVDEVIKEEDQTDLNVIVSTEVLEEESVTDVEDPAISRVTMEDTVDNPAEETLHIVPPEEEIFLTRKEQENVASGKDKVDSLPTKEPFTTNKSTDEDQYGGVESKTAEETFSTKGLTELYEDEGIVSVVPMGEIEAETIRESNETGLEIATVTQTPEIVQFPVLSLVTNSLLDNISKGLPEDAIISLPKKRKISENDFPVDLIEAEDFVPLEKRRRDSELSNEEIKVSLPLSETFGIKATDIENVDEEEQGMHALQDEDNAMENDQVPYAMTEEIHVDDNLVESNVVDLELGEGTDVIEEKKCEEEHSRENPKVLDLGGDRSSRTFVETKCVEVNVTESQPVIETEDKCNLANEILCNAKDRSSTEDRVNIIDEDQTCRETEDKTEEVYDSEYIESELVLDKLIAHQQLDIPVQEHNNEVEIKCGDDSPDSFKFSIQTNLSILSQGEEMSSFALETLSEMKANLESNENVNSERNIEHSVLVETDMASLNVHLEKNQVQVPEQVVSVEKKAITLSNFSLDFGDVPEDTGSTNKPKQDVKKRKAYGRRELISILEGNSDGEKKEKEPSLDIYDFEEHIPSQIVCTKDLKKNIQIDEEPEVKVTRKKRSRTSMRTASKLSMVEKDRKFALNVTPSSNVQENTKAKSVSRKSLAKQPIKSATKTQQSNTEHGKDAGTLLIRKTSKEATKPKPELTRSPGKAKILQQTILRPARNVTQPRMSDKPTDSIFDINSMPIDIVSTESLEKIPQMAKGVSRAANIVSKPSASIVTTSQTATNKTITFTKSKPPRILQTYGRKSTGGVKPGKYIVVPHSSISSMQYFAKDATVTKTVESSTGAIQKTINAPSESSGNKIMIVTDQHGKQQRLLLTPEQQKLLGFQTKIAKTVKGGVIQNKAVTSVTTEVSLQTAITQGQATSCTVTGNQRRRAQKKPSPTVEKVVGKPQKTIIIKNHHGQTVKKIQGTDDELLDQQVAEQLMAIQASTGLKFNSPPNQLKTNTAPKAALRRTYSNRSDGKSAELPPLTSIHQSPKQKSAAMPKATTKKVGTPKPNLTQVSKREHPEKSVNQLVIQDAVGNQTTITEGQILALPSETVDGQPQSYMLVTLDESGNLTPLNNEALLSLDPNLNLAGDLSNVVLQIDQGVLSDSVVKTPEVTQPVTPKEKPPRHVVETSVPAEILQGAKGKIPSTGIKTGQQLIVTGDPVATQKFLESLSEGTTDLSNILANAEGKTIFIQADGQQFLIDNSQLPLPVNIIEGAASIYETQSGNNQDILAAALAGTEMFPSVQRSKTDSRSPSSVLQPMNVGNVLETSLTLNTPIMTPLEVSSTEKKIPDDETDTLTKVPTIVDLPITVTDPNIVQTVANQQVAMDFDELHTVTVPSTQTRSTSILSLPGLEASDITDLVKPLSCSMPLLNEEVQEATDKNESRKGYTPTKESNGAVGIDGSPHKQGRFTLGGELCSSLSEPPPDTFDIPGLNRKFPRKRKAKGAKNK